MIPTVTVVPANPTIVDQCGTENDSVTFATTDGVTCTRDGNDVVATLASGYVWGTTPAGWVSAPAASSSSTSTPSAPSRATCSSRGT